MKCLFPVFIALILACFTYASDIDVNTVNIDCRLEVIPSMNLRALNLTFYKTHPPSDKTEQMLRVFLESSSALFPDKDIVAKAWSNPTGNDTDETSIALKDGSTALYYRSATKSIQTDNEAHGAKSMITSDAQKNYSVQYEEKTYPQPIGKKASVQVVFKTTPPDEEVYRVLVEEIRKAMATQVAKLMTTASAYTGDLSNPSGMIQIRGSAGIYLFVECNPSDGQIVCKNFRTGQVRNFGKLQP